MMFFKKKQTSLTESDVRAIFHQEIRKQKDIEKWESKFEGKYTPPTLSKIFPELSRAEFDKLRTTFSNLSEDEVHKLNFSPNLYSFYTTFPEILFNYLKAVRTYPEIKHESP